MTIEIAEALKEINEKLSNINRNLKKIEIQESTNKEILMKLKKLSEESNIVNKKMNSNVKNIKENLDEIKEYL